MLSFAGLKETPYVSLDSMDRPSRKTKAVNYRESTKDFDDDDDDDFAFVKAPPSKKAREEPKKPSSSSSSSSSQDTGAQSTLCQKSRKPLDQKLSERDLEAAITLSSLNYADETKDRLPAAEGDVKVLIPADENTDPASRHLSNCSVEGAVLGLDEISAETGSPASSRQRKSCAVQQKPVPKEEDEDYRPKLTPDSESDEDFCEAEESEDDEFTSKKVSKTKKKENVTEKEKTKSTPVSKREKQPPKAAKSKSAAAAAASAAAASTPVRSPPAAKSASRRPVQSSTVSTAKPAASVSPAGGRIPKWNPPGQLGKSPTSSLNAALKSPGQGLRLGLSRFVRVKPLHPSVAGH
ncbi:RAD51-associated protein 1 [Solea solea]|uniref:RAD51-associated protein 1 n=1 Tax=Solea solea TaxID=90069 RepID=UPI00272DC2D2|nr:RAD51-associated protein 1 [Solea solea]